MPGCQRDAASGIPWRKQRRRQCAVMSAAKGCRCSDMNRCGAMQVSNGKACSATHHDAAAAVVHPRPWLGARLSMGRCLPADGLPAAVGDAAGRHGDPPEGRPPQARVPDAVCGISPATPGASRPRMRRGFARDLYGLAAGGAGRIAPSRQHKGVPSAGGQTGLFHALLTADYRASRMPGQRNADGTGPAHRVPAFSARALRNTPGVRPRGGS